MEVVLLCLGTLLFATVALLIVTFKKIGYGLLQSTLLGLLIVIPLVTASAVEFIYNIIIIIRNLTLILGGTNYQEVLEKCVILYKKR